MLRKLLYLVIAAYLAWYAGPWLTKLFWFLPITDIASALTPINLLSKGATFYISFFLWMLILWCVMQATGLMFIMAGPQRYGETIQARFVKGAVAELLVLAVIAAPILWLVFACGGKVVVIAGMEHEPSQATRGWLMTLINGPAAAPEATPWESASIWRQGFFTVKYLWWAALPFALPAHFFLHKRVKKLIARGARPFTRFLHKGRIGLGGSARFAGILEEWLLQER